MTNIAKVQQLLDFIDASPSPWHAVATMEQALLSASFIRLSETQSWQLETGGRYYVVRDDSSAENPGNGA
jgi:aspartyl aminopeptidase